MKKSTLRSPLPLLICFLFAGMSLAHAQQNHSLIQNWLEQSRTGYGWTTDDISQWRISDDYTDAPTGITHTYIQQTHQGIPVFNAISVFAIKEGRIVHFAPGLISNLKQKINTTIPRLTYKDAVVAAARYLERPISGEPRLLNSDVQKNEYELEVPGLTARPVLVRLLFQPAEGGQVMLAWEVSIDMPEGNHWWNIRMDAVKGTYLDKNDYVTECHFGPAHDHDAEAAPAASPYPAPLPLPAPPPPSSYNVFAVPVEAPTFGSRTIVNDPSDSLASPYGWHDVNGTAGADYTITRGNNVNCYEDGDNNNLPGYSPDGTSSLTFNFPYNIASAPLTNQDAALTNLFYMNNTLHDRLYHWGFTDAAGNFQQNNYGRGGLGNDQVLAEGFDGGGTNNANFATPADGSSGRMQMYLWSGTPQKDGNFDNGIIAHEYGHGLSNRLTGGPANSSCLGNSEQGGEGWSDWLGLMMTIEPGDSGAMGRGIGTYALGQATTGAGIRRYRYSTNMAINPQTYADLATSSGAHQKGEIWCDAIWDMSWFLINNYGFNSNPDSIYAGNNVAMRLVLEGMKLQPCSPGYIDARDAILLADQLLYNNLHRCVIWEAFARRGMGFGASQGLSTSSTDQTVSFTMPAFCLIATQPPVAGFTANTLSVACAGTVTFSDTSIQAHTWEWNFGDQTTSTLQNPTHAYSSPGTYTVKLKVTNPLGVDSVIKVAYITVTPTFSATAVATPASACNGDPVTLSSAGSGSANIQYTVAAIPFAPLSGTGTTVTLSDDVMSSVKPIGFTFSYYGQNYTNFYISSNGFITFSSGMPATPVYGPVIPGTSTPNNLIAVAWNDLNPAIAGSVVDYFNTGVSPNMKLVVRYNTWHYGGTSYPFIVQVVLSEGSNEIEIHNTTISNASAFDVNAKTTQGVENQNGTKATVVPGRNSAHLTVSGDAYRFTPGVAYNYTWQPGNLNGSTQVISPVATSTYTVSVTDGSGCTITNSATVTVNPVPVAAISGPLAFCAGGSTTLDAGGGYSSYIWSTGATTQTISVASAGIYSVTVTNGYGCTGSAAETVSVLAAPSASIIGTLTVCSGSSTTLDAGAGFSSYNWSTGATTQTISVNSGGTYTLTVTNANGCTATASETVSVFSNPSPSISGALSFCSGGSTTLDAGAGYSAYNWSTGASTQTILVSTGATHTVTVTDANGCTGSASVTTSVSTSLSPVISGPLTFCSGGFTTLDAGAGYNTYAWSTGASTQTIAVNTAGNYAVTVSSLSGCTGSATAVVTVSSDLAANASPVAVSCFGQSNGSVSTNPFGGTSPYSWLWSNGSTQQNISGLAAGTYTVTVTDASGCTAVSSVIVTQPAAITISSTITNLVCKAINTGSIFITPAGGTPPYTYLWHNGTTVQNRTNLYANTYVVTVTDINGCTKKSSYTVTQPATSLLVNTTKTNVRCYGASTGQITVSPSGGVSPYTYAWNTVPVKTTATITGLAAGVYSCTVTDAGNCSKTVTVTIIQPANLVVVQSQTNVTTPGGNDGTASVAVSGGVSPYTYSWNTVPVSTNSSVTNLAAGTYKCTVKDSKNCSKKATFIITQPGARQTAGPSTDQLTVYPNPTSGLVSVLLQSTSEQSFALTLENLSGQILIRKSGMTGNGTHESVLDLQGFAWGVYVLKVQGERSSLVRRIVVQ